MRIILKRIFNTFNKLARILILLSLMIMMNSPPIYAEDNGTAEAEVFLSGMLDETIKILKDEGASAEEKRALLVNNIHANLDLAYMSARALGSSIESFSKEQFAEFSQEFARHLTHFYLRRMATFKGDKIEITDAIFNKKSGVVKLRTLGGVRHTMFQSRRSSHIAQVDYHLREKNDEWRIVAITIDGVNVSRNFRKQFKALLDKENPDAIIAKLRMMNAENRERNPFE